MNNFWRQEYIIGIPEIDVQHQRLFSLIESNNQFKEKDHNDEIVHKIYRYAAFHFKSEEDLMDLYDYPNIESQRESHVKFLQFLISRHHEESNNKEDFRHYLFNWIISHIENEDKFFGYYMNSNKLLGENHGRETCNQSVSYI